MSEKTATQVLRGRPVTHDEAAASADRLINSRFGQSNGARASIPARPDDDDIVIVDYILERRASDPIHSVPAAAPEEKPASEAQIRHMVARFLGWKLPENFNPDGGIVFMKIANEGTAFASKREPTGTNLLDAQQAKEMVRYMIEGLPAPASSPAPVAPAEPVSEPPNPLDNLSPLPQRLTNALEWLKKNTEGETRAWVEIANCQVEALWNQRK